MTGPMYTIDDDTAEKKEEEVVPPPPPPPSTAMSAATSSTVVPGMPLPPPPSAMMMIDPTTGQYHPEFMFCGSCSTCQDPDPIRADRQLNDTEIAVEELLGSQHTTGANADTDDDDDDDNNLMDFYGIGSSPKPTSHKKKKNHHNKNEDSVVIRSQFNLLRPISCKSHALVLQSLLQPLPGVIKVVIPLPQQQQQQQQTGQETAVVGTTGTTTRRGSSTSMDPTLLQIIIDHDARTTPELILSTLETVGHQAILQANQAPASGMVPLLVRSQFAVRGVCCASEIPILRKIVLPVKGVSKLQINLTTKAVYVQHDINTITASDIAKLLTKEGFPAVVKKDGSSTVAAQRRAINHGRSTLHVNHILTEQDISPIQQYLSRIPGVSRIGINVSEAVIYVDHDLVDVTSKQCIEQLKQANYDCIVVIAAEEQYQKLQQQLLVTQQQQQQENDVGMEGNENGSKNNIYMTPMAVAQTVAALEGVGRSKYVESTISIDNLQSKHISTIQKAISQNFIRAQVRAIYPNVHSHTIKVEHDPKLVSILDVCHTLDSYNTLPSNAKISVNGSDLQLYLPLQEDYSSFGGNNSSREGVTDVVDNDDLIDPLAIRSIRLNVILSGIFWFISILSIKGGNWEFLKWFGLASVICGLPPILIKAWRTLRRYQLDANCMMVTAAIGACILGEFDEAASVSFLFAVSEFLEARATLKARRALSAICGLRPDHANVIHPVTKELIVIPADRVPLGSLISVKTGDKIATDGVIVEGSSAVDESSLTGESKPVHKQVQDHVSGGTINIGTTQLVVRTTTTVEDSAVSRLIRLVEEAQSNRSPTEKMIDTFARSYTPAVVFMAALMCTIPWAWGSEVGHYWTLNGLIIIVIACPCALTISTPVTYAAGLAASAQRGIIVKGGANLEAMGSVDKIVFDKTGTLTQGKFTVIHLEVIGTNKTRTEMLELLALLQGRSSHPLSATLVQAAKREGVAVPVHMSVTEHSILKGEGVTAKIDGVNMYAGNQRLFARLGWFDTLSLHHKDLIANWEATGGTVGLLGTEEHGIIGAFCVKDSVREQARGAIETLRDAGIEIIMCTGDSHAAAHSVAHELGIPRGGVHSQLLPEDKLHFVGSLKRPQPKSFGICRNKQYVMFLGDGINDAPALAVADVGVSMGEGAAMAMEMSDVTLMDSNLAKLPYVIQMGRRVVATVKENIVVSLTAKLVIVALTFMGKMTLLLAIAADVGIMLVVTLNGMKLLPGRTADVNFNFSSEEASTYDTSVTLAPLKNRIRKYDSVPTRNSVTDDLTQPNIEMMTSPTHVDSEIV